MATACAEIEEPGRPAEPAEIQAPTELSAVQTRAVAAASYDVMPNPYSLANMQAVYNDALVDDIVLRPTHLYVRFLPQDSLQMNRLKYDLGLELFDYPLDVQLADGEVYVDPSIPEGQFMWQYTTVPANFAPPAGITCQILESCYIPGDDEAIAATRGGEVHVETAAFERLGYTVEPQTRAASYPTGRITVYDDSAGAYVPVSGVKIRCHTVIKWSTAYTDENGYYTMQSKFRIGPHYAIVFDNAKGFDIWGNWGPLARANYNMGWHSKSGHDRAIGRDSQAWPWAAVNNAAYAYYQMCEQTGIAKPPANLKIWVAGAWGNSAPMLRRVWHPIGVNGNSSWVNFFLNISVGAQATIINTVLKLVEPDITIDRDSRNYRSMYNTVNHELAHASHFSRVGSAFWAKYISYILTYGAYGNGTGNNAELCGISEMWGYAMGARQEYGVYDPGGLSENYQNSVTSGPWIKPHVFWDLIRRGVLTPKQIYDCLTPEVDTYQELIAKMYQRHPAQADAIETAFATHGIVRDVPKPGTGTPVLNAPSISSTTPATSTLPVGAHIVVTVRSPQAGVSYEWERDGKIVSGVSGPTYSFYNERAFTRIRDGEQPPGDGDNPAPSRTRLSVRCRARSGARVSEWSNSLAWWVYR